mgnify:CR=1 FL=1
MTGEEAELFCGCRTEKGVHAYGQVANFKLNSRQNCMELRNYLNRYLPRDIAVLKWKQLMNVFTVSCLQRKQRICIGLIRSLLPVCLKESIVTTHFIRSIMKQ